MNAQSIIDSCKALYHKDGVDSNDWDRVHPSLLVLADYVIAHCEAHMLPLTITSIIRPKIKGVSKTDIHAKGRAFDVSVGGWQPQDIAYLVGNVNETLTIGAISLRDNKEREAVWEPSEFDAKGKQTKWPHLHFQVRA